MTCGWHSRLSLGLLLLALGGLVQPALAAPLAADSCCPGMAMAAPEEGHPQQTPARCQWLTSTPCCDEAAAKSVAPAFAPVPPPACSRAAVPSSAERHWVPARPAAPSSQAAALATTVLRL